MLQNMTKPLLLLSCREVGCYDYCDYIVTGKTEEEVIRSTVEHDMKEHGKTKKDILKMREKLKDFIYAINY